MAAQRQRGEMRTTSRFVLTPASLSEEARRLAAALEKLGPDSTALPQRQVMSKLRRLRAIVTELAAPDVPRTEIFKIAQEIQEIRQLVVDDQG